MKYGEGNVFTGVCSQGTGGLWPGRGLCPDGGLCPGKGSLSMRSRRYASYLVAFLLYHISVRLYFNVLLSF